MHRELNVPSGALFRLRLTRLMPSKSTHPDRVNAQGIAKISAIDDSLAASAFLLYTPPPPN